MTILRPGAFVVVVDASNQKIVLVKHSYGERKWGLPGGGLENGENPTDGAIREVREETGLAIIQPDFVGTFELQINTGVIHLFAATSSTGQLHQNSCDGEISQAKFMTLVELECRHAEIYPAQLKLVEWWQVWQRKPHLPIFRQPIPLLSPQKVLCYQK